MKRRKGLQAIVYKVRLRALLLMCTLILTGHLVHGQAQISNDSLHIPAAVRVARDGRQALPAVDRFFYLDELDADDEKNIFDAPPCLEGQYYVGFQLQYDLGDMNTSLMWECNVDLSLLQGEDTLWTKPLAINMAEQTFIATIFHDALVSCGGDYRVYIKNKQTAAGLAPAPEPNILVHILLYKKTDAVFNPADEIELNCTYSTGITNLGWSYDGEAEEYDVEWVFIEEHENFTGTTQEAFQFKEPVRVSVAAPRYSHLLYYPNGRVWYRVRAIGVNPDYPQHRINGNWFYQSGSPITITNHETDKTWQLQTVFAEEGKYKKVMQYYDGSMRQRQTQTNLSSDTTTLVGETLYDYEGRRSVDILPVPVMETSLSYRPAFNTFAASQQLVTDHTSADRHKFHYDNRRIINSTVANTSGAGKYYSDQNNTGGIHRDLIPDAEGYVYSQTEYLNDGTGRIARQSGVGKEFSSDGDHTTRYFYAGATRSELVRLFGANVGNASHYKKNLVVDPNGQVSVSYLDQEGRVIATALAGVSPDNVDPLESYTGLDLSPVTEKIGDKNRLEDGKSITRHRFLNVAPNTEYTFRYDLSALASEVESIGCQSCSFDLDIALTDPDGMLVELPGNIPGNQSTDSRYYRRDSITAACDNPAIINDIEFQVTLADIGDYTITKTLVPHELSFDQMKTVLEQDSTTQVLMQQIRDSYVADPTECEICTETCDEAEAYIEEAIDEIAALDCENILRQIEQYYIDQYPDSIGYMPKQQQISSHPLYCKYLLCVKNQESDAFDKRQARVQSWSAAVTGGKSNPVETDPFFNNASLSGYTNKSGMQDMLDNISLGTIGSTTYAGTIGEVTNPANTDLYVNGSGEHDVNGKHILYLDLMSRRIELGETAYQHKLDEQRWVMYRGMYEEAKRQVKLSISEYQACPSAMEELQPYSDLASYSEEDVKQWGNANGMKDSVSVAELEMSLYSITNACGATLSSPDSATVMNHLQAYFDSNPQNLLRLIHTEDVATDTHLSAINDVLSGYNCALDSVALVNMMSCVRETTITMPRTIVYPNQVHGAQTLPVTQAGKTTSVEKADPRRDDHVNLEKIRTAPDSVASMIALEIENEVKSRVLADLESSSQRSFSDQNISPMSAGLPTQTEYNALIALYNATNGTNWTYRTGWMNANPNIVEDVSGWYGVTTDGNGHVTRLDLKNNRLKGPLPPEIGNLTHLYALQLSENQLNGTLPVEIGNLSELENLNLYTNELHGTIDVLGSLTKLTYLVLFNNQFSGSIDVVGNFPDLISLELQGFLTMNHFQGSIPTALWNCSKLKYLNLSGNELAGSLSAISGLSSIEYLDLSSQYYFNELDSIPSSIGSLAKLRHLGLGRSQLKGIIPAVMGNLANLESLNLSENQLTESIPSSFGNLDKLKSLSLFSNQLIGQIPESLGNTALGSLLLNNNQLTGQIPESLGNTVLTSLNLSDNLLTGRIPETFVNLRFTSLRLSRNKLNGSIPESFGNLSLTSLYLDGNEFSGRLPVGILKSNITQGDCRNNNFTFADLIPAAAGYTYPGGGAFRFGCAPQGLIDVEKRIPLTMQPIIFTTSIDRNTVPKCKYQWFKYSNGTSVALTPLDTSSHTFTIVSPTTSDLGHYYYKIINTGPFPAGTNLSQLVLESHLQTVDSAGLKYVTFCLQYDSTNKTLQKFSYQVNLNDLIAQCMARAAKEDSILTDYAINRLLQEKATSFYNEFMTKCMKGVNENLQYTYVPKEYHYTLYYYDQSANLVQTVPPSGVHPLTAGQVEPSHHLITRYQYNSLNQLIWQSTPDAGESQFWYNDKGQLRLSQNAQQRADALYSYTRYDKQGRIAEVGELHTAIELNDLLAGVDSLPWPQRDKYALTDVTRTHYDFGKASIQASFPQSYLRTRVSWVEVVDRNASDTMSTYYSYDVHGNVKSLQQDIPGLDAKRTDYVYDLVSGKVNYVMYQFDKPDQFMHQYAYDADNRITSVLTSTDGFIWDRDANYRYYQHGPLARVELGEYRAHGLDYYYTLQGWIKGVNMPYAGDPGEDGVNSISGKDVFSYALGYYNNDYKPINNSVTLSDSRDHLWTRLNEVHGHWGLYNGNISWMVTDLSAVASAQADRTKGMQAMMYKYDQLHRITTSRSLTAYSAANGFASRTIDPSAYDEDYSYDGNGNLLTLQRRDNEANLLNSFNYLYYPGTNRLRQVELPVDKVYDGGAIVTNTEPYRKITIQGNAYVPQGQAVELWALEEIEMDPDFEVPDGTDFLAYIAADSGMYQYDAIGNLMRDRRDGVKISWTPYGKVREVRAKSDSLITTFRYDGSGNRIEKRVTREGSVDVTHVTHYVRDASGNVMGVYSDSLMTEQYVYGSSRLGLYRGGRYNGQQSLGEKQYELSNHLGNVLAVITDNIGMSTSDSVCARVVSTRDYYPFGLEMQGRTFTDSTSYRYGFNGKEKDQHGEFGNTHYDYGFRIYDPVISRFKSVDPLTVSYPWYTPYQFAGNMPIWATDLDGLEELIAPFENRPYQPVINASDAGTAISNSLNNALIFVPNTVVSGLNSIAQPINATYKSISNKGNPFTDFIWHLDGGINNTINYHSRTSLKQQGSDAINTATDLRTWEAALLMYATMRPASAGSNTVKAGMVAEAMESGLVTARTNLARQFYSKAGYTVEKSVQHMEGINFNKAVQSTTLKEGTVVQQWVGENGIGNYFTPLENGAAQNLGISYEGRTLQQFTLTQDVKVLQSTAADYKGQAGGGVQYFSTELKQSITPVE